MPELPEVETVRRAMERHLVGRSIRRVATSDKKLRQPMPRKKLAELAGATFTAARRRAKFLLLDLDVGCSLLVHLGMSGNLLLRRDGEKHDHVVFHLDRGLPLVYTDPRRFGMVLVQTPEQLGTNPFLVHLGVEPLERGFSAAYLAERCRDRSRPIKTMIMDNRIVVGVGNIYASEALFGAGIHPQRPAGSLDGNEIGALTRQIKKILRDAIRRGGTTISDYLGSGQGGLFQQRLAVYGRDGQPCRTCSAPVESLVMAGRNTFYCPRCQT